MKTLLIFSVALENSHNENPMRLRIWTQSYPLLRDLSYYHLKKQQQFLCVLFFALVEVHIIFLPVLLSWPVCAILLLGEKISMLGVAANP